MTKYIVVVGGVISGVGKGVIAASLGRLCKDAGFSTTIIKIDPYINYDAGTLRPTEHGEVWVTADGREVDQDLGNYERFMDQVIPHHNSITTGQIYKTVIDNERQGHYLGQTVQCIPHIPQEIIRRIQAAATGYDIALIEVGGVVGDYENTPFLFATKMLQHMLGMEYVAYVLVSYLITLATTGEIKTKPTQQAIKMLRHEGITPDMVICRTQHPVDAELLTKVGVTSYIASDAIIAAPDVASIYEVPLCLEQAGALRVLVERLKLALPRAESMVSGVWQASIAALRNPQSKVRVGVVGKYLSGHGASMKDSYLSIEQSLLHAAAHQGVGVEIAWITTADTASLEQCAGCDALIVPGGYGVSGVEEKIKAIQYARVHRIPYLGICYGMQLAVVEYARHVCGLSRAHTVEVDQATPHPVISLLEEQQRYMGEASAYGGTMRLGTYPAHLVKGSKVYALYSAAQRVVYDAQTQEAIVSERHRHRYEVNPAYCALLEAAGARFSGYYEGPNDIRLVEYFELPDHPFFIAVQAHPEFTSRMGNPNPLFSGLITAALQRSVDTRLR